MILSTFISNKPKSRSDRQYIYMPICFFEHAQKKNQYLCQKAF